MLPRKVSGVEQTGATQVEHTAVDYRPLIAVAVFIVFTALALVATEVTR